MIQSVVVVDGFYNDPDEVRLLALTCDFSVAGNYPGRRTGPFLHSGIRQGIQSLIQTEIVVWPENTYNGAFQFTVATDKSWIHSDHTTNYAGVVYLTPDAPSDSGTIFYRHKESGCTRYPEDNQLQKQCEKDAPKPECWQELDVVSNVFNRLVLFDSRRFHCSGKYFGKELNDARLFQTFFFSVAF